MSTHHLVPVACQQRRVFITSPERKIVYADSHTLNALGIVGGQTCSEYSKFFPCFEKECQCPGTRCPLWQRMEQGAVPSSVEARSDGWRSEIAALPRTGEGASDLLHLQAAEPQQVRPDPPDTEPGGLQCMPGFVGSHPSMRRLFNLIELVAPSDITIHISGENGTGKELVASAIHRLSHRRDRPFVTVNCSSIPSTLLESSLFGHVKGAFTGACRDQKGFVEAAHNGTLFLDEIGELTPELQVKLLRLLESRSYSRIGESVSRTADIRILTATNRDLKALVERGSFREDFYYRVHVFPLAVPSLRDRVSDIELLSKHFIAKLNARYGKRVTGLSSDVVDLFRRYSWPGNVRELENCIEHAFVFLDVGEIRLEQLPAELLHSPVACTQQYRSHGRHGISDEDIVQVLREAGGNRTHAARRLGISRVTLWKRLKAYNRRVEPPVVLDKPSP